METRTEIKKQRGFSALLQYPDFIKVWVGRTVSRFGDAIDSIAFMWLMYKLTGSMLLMGTVMAVNAIPSLFGMAAGVLVDRMDKKKIMVWMDFLRGISTALIALLYITGGLEIWHLYAFTFFNSACEVFSSPARASAMQVLVDKEHYLASNSLSQASGSAAEIFGTGVAAAIIGIWGVGIAILIDSATFVISAFTALIADIEAVNESNGALNISKFFKELLEGLHIIKSSALIFMSIILGCLVNILLAPFNLLLPVYSDKVLNSGEGGYSLMGISIMVGTIIGAVIIGLLGSRLKKSSIILIGFSIFALSIGSLGFVNDLIPAILLCILAGSSISIISATSISVVQENTPREKMGRVASTFNTIALLGMPLGYAISGVVGQTINVQLIYIIIGIIMLLICIPPLFNKEFRKA